MRNCQVWKACSHNSQGSRARCHSLRSQAGHHGLSNPVIVGHTGEQSVSVAVPHLTCGLCVPPSLAVTSHCVGGNSGAPPGLTEPVLLQPLLPCPRPEDAREAPLSHFLYRLHDTPPVTCTGKWHGLGRWKRRFSLILREIVILRERCTRQSDAPAVPKAMATITTRRPRIGRAAVRCWRLLQALLP